MRLRIRPPSSAPMSAAHRVTGAPPLAGGVLARAAFSSSAFCSASGTAAGSAATAGQVPCTGSARRTPAGAAPSPGGLARASTRGTLAGPSLRWADSGTWAVQRSPSQAWVQAAPGSIRPGVSGRNSRVLPRQAAGRPLTLALRKPGSGVNALPAAGWSLGATARAASNTRPCSAVEPCTGMRRLNVPSSGMHSLRHDSQVAWSCTSMWPPVNDGSTCSGTGSSTVPL